MRHLTISTSLQIIYLINDVCGPKTIRNMILLRGSKNNQNFSQQIPLENRHIVARINDDIGIGFFHINLILFMCC